MSLKQNKTSGDILEQLTTEILNFLLKVVIDVEDRPKVKIDSLKNYFILLAILHNSRLSIFYSLQLFLPILY